MREPRVLRPMEYGEIFNEGFDLYKRNFALFAGIGAVVYVPYALLTALTANYQILTGLITLGLYIPLVAAGGAIMKAVADRYLGKEATIAGSWNYVLGRLGPFFGTSLLAGLLVMIGFLLLFIPGIIAAFWIFFVWNVMIVEDRFGFAAIRRSRELAAGQWRRIFNIAVLTALLTGVGTLIVTMIVGVLAATVPGGAPGAGPGDGPDLPLPVLLVHGLLNAALQTAIAPLTTILGLLLYFDVRVRKEGFDVELLAQEMGEPPTGPGHYAAPA